jgi:hypothetical protein
MVEAKVQREALGLVDYVELIIDKIRQKYSEAICLMNNEVYGDQDVDIEIYVPEEKLLEVERFAHEVALRETEGTEWFILPSVAPLESCPVKAV